MRKEGASLAPLQPIAGPHFSEWDHLHPSHPTVLSPNSGAAESSAIMALRRAGASLLGRLAGVQLEVAQPSTAVPTALRAITSAATAQAPVHIEDEVYNR